MATKLSSLYMKVIFIETFSYKSARRQLTYPYTKIGRAVEWPIQKRAIAR